MNKPVSLSYSELIKYQLAAFNDALQSIELTLQVIAQSHRDTTVVSGLLHRLEDVCEQAVRPLGELQRLSETKLRRHQDGQPLQAAKWAWIRQKKVIHRLQNRLRSAKESLAPLLLALIAHSSVLQMNLIDTEGSASRYKEQIAVLKKPDDSGWIKSSTALPLHVGEEFYGDIAKQSSYTPGEVLLFDRGEFSPFDSLDDGTSLLHYAGSNGRTGMCVFLIRNGADKYFRDSHGIAAIQPGLDLFLKNGLSGVAGFDLFSEEAFSDNQGFTFLHRIILGHCPIDLNEHLRHSPTGNLDVFDSNRRTPLLWAAWSGRVDYVQLLVDYGAEVEHKDLEHESALSKACKAGHIECAKTLLKAGASPHTGNCYHVQPIHYASQQKHHIAIGLLDALLKHGADVNARTDSLATPLHFAASSGVAENVDYLIQHDANLQARNRSHLDASLLALANWHNDLFCYLVRLGADIQPSPGSVLNVLHLAAWGGSDDSWTTIEEAVRDDRLCGTNLNMWHNEHIIWDCLDKCRPFRSYNERQTEETDYANIRKIQKTLQISLNELEPKKLSGYG
ncbi:MAG: hypothetical protein Q9157_003290 [Trypethelium eluteriae]